MNKQAKERGEETEEGFTLIELLIVIVVLGILAAVTVFALSGTTAKSAQAACDADAQTVNVALAAYQVQTPNTAATLSGLVSAGYLQTQPNSSHYNITLSAFSSSSIPTQTVMVGQTGPPVVAAATYPAPSGTADPCSTVK